MSKNRREVGAASRGVTMKGKITKMRDQLQLLKMK
jgi:hypothetical protein